MKRSLRMSLLFGAVSLGMATAAGVTQTPESGTIPEGTSVARPTGALHLHVVVTPNNGEPVANLNQQMFTVLDDGKTQPITAFHAVTGQAEPVKVMLVLDAVNIDYVRLSYARDQIESFLKAKDGQLAQPTSLVLLTDTSTEATPSFTTDGNALNQTLKEKEIGLRELRRSSGFYGAGERLDMSLRGLQGLVARAAAVPGRKLIIWISPGWPLLSGPAVELSRKDQASIYREAVDFSTQMRQNQITLYSVDPLGAGEGIGRSLHYEEFLKGVRKPSEAVLGDLGLQVLAVQSGGLALTGSNDVRGALQRCVNDAKASYELTYEPPPADAGEAYHRIEVRVAEPHLQARTTQGYYTQP